MLTSKDILKNFILQDEEEEPEIPLGEPGGDEEEEEDADEDLDEDLEG